MITVIGLGFVGLTTALGFADKGFKVFGLDNDRNRFKSLSKNQVPFFEPNLESKLIEHSDKKSFELSNNLNYSIKESNVIFVCVGTPQSENGSVSLDYLFVALRDILENINDNQERVVVIKSTVPPSTCNKVIQPFIKENNVNNSFISIASNPEFLREGFAWNDFLYPDRIVIGASDEFAKNILNNIYKPFNVPIHFSNTSTAEFIKYLSNTLLSNLISYSNEMSMIAHTIGSIDIKYAFNVLHQDKRWSGMPANMSSYAYPGCGYGGYCLPKDTEALIFKANEGGYKAKLLREVQNVNFEIKTFVALQIMNICKPSDVIGILGLSFKPNSDDVRDAPAASIIKILNDSGFNNVIAHDPLAIDEFKGAYPRLSINYQNKASDVLDLSTIAVILTGWDEYKIYSKEKDKILDFRYIL